ncbi:mechanosensitive ion channel family protein [Paraliomyxa miuraensis]|uniref:mechanosensitive ion channel family protein n=1 Tax=Paraliomyxa miuraensis TaxID=376150 RepID=UPI002258C911|nr:mechanosensitive ion channel domain-containing protein [Paraliomyxa miuraensis]MCX4244259.1 mechanosensitive ion channel family protein [Paraliomyxa miuraensis]
MKRSCSLIPSSSIGLAGLGLAGLVPVLAGLVVLAVPSAALAEDTDLDSLSQIAGLVRWSGVLSSLVLIAAVTIAMRFLHDTVAGLSRRFTSRRLLLQKIATILQFLVYIISGLAVVALSFRLTDAAIALIGGTVAVSVGFAIKDVVASFIAGIMIMVDRPFQVGDRVTFGGQYGDITAIGLRSVRLQTLDDNTVTIPNNKFLNEITSNGNYGALDMMVVMDFHIGPDQDVQLARELVTEAAVSSRFVFLEKPVVVLTNQVILESHVAIRLRLKAYVLDTRYEKAFETDVNMRVLEAFATEHIAPPAVLHRTWEKLRPVSAMQATGSD